jgi:hypothetical protein
VIVTFEELGSTAGAL